MKSHHSGGASLRRNLFANIQKMKNIGRVKQPTRVLKQAMFMKTQTGSESSRGKWHGFMVVDVTYNGSIQFRRLPCCRKRR